MARGFKIFGLILLTFLVVWAVVIVQWQQTHRLPDTSDIVLYLIALPIGLLLVFLMSLTLLSHTALLYLLFQ